VLQEFSEASLASNSKTKIKIKATNINLQHVVASVADDSLQEVSQQIPVSLAQRSTTSTPGTAASVST
jgi:hypothetical protein